LARKVDVLFNFPSRSHCTCNTTYGKTMYMVAYFFFQGPLLIRLVGLKAPSPRIKVARTWNITFSHLYVLCRLHTRILLQYYDYRLEEEIARKKQQQDEEERRLEQQRRQTEALRRLQEQQQRAKTAPWSQQTPGTGSSLVDIQRQEKEKKEVLTS